ncbi:MAG: twin-arginine translocase subunit TatC, partial [Opitutales bacterium]
MPPSGPADPHADTPPPPPAQPEDDEFNEFPDFLAGESDDTAPAAGSAPRAPGEMGFLDHLEEFRVTAIKCVAALLAGMGIVGAFFPWFFEILLYPLNHAVRLAGVDPKSFDMLYSNSLMGVFSVILEVTLFGGIALAL